MSDQRNIVHRVLCGCDAGGACPEWDACLNAELAVRTQFVQEQEQMLSLRAYTESWPDAPRPAE